MCFSSSQIAIRINAPPPRHYSSTAKEKLLPLPQTMFYYSLSEMPKQFNCCEMFIRCREMLYKIRSASQEASTAFGSPDLLFTYLLPQNCFALILFCSIRQIDFSMIICYSLQNRSGTPPERRRPLPSGSGASRLRGRTLQVFSRSYRYRFHKAMSCLFPSLFSNIAILGEVILSP